MKEKQKNMCRIKRGGAGDLRIPKTIMKSWPMLTLRTMSGSMVQEQQGISYHQNPGRYPWSELPPGFILMSESFDSSPHPYPGYL